MGDIYFKNILKTLGIFEKETGLNICIHDLLNSFRKNSQLIEIIEKYKFHFTDFCKKVKERKHMKCIIWDIDYVIEEFRKTDECIVRVCHGGATEIIFPVKKYSTLTAVIFIGQFNNGSGPKSLPFFDELQIERVIALGYLLCGYISDLINKIGKNNNYNETLLEKLNVFFNCNFTKDPSLMDFSSWVDLSKSHIQHLLNKKHQTSFQIEKDKFKIEKIQYYLKNTNISLKSIASYTGFKNADYLSIFYKKKTGVSPSAYRNNNFNQEDGVLKNSV